MTRRRDDAMEKTTITTTKVTKRHTKVTRTWLVLAPFLLAGALALLLFASSFLSAIRRRELYPRSMRLVVSVPNSVSVPLMGPAASACLTPIAAAVLPVPPECFAQLDWAGLAMLSARFPTITPAGRVAAGGASRGVAPSWPLQDGSDRHGQGDLVRQLGRLELTRAADEKGN